MFYAVESDMHDRRATFEQEYVDQATDDEANYSDAKRAFEPAREVKANRLNPSWYHRHQTVLQQHNPFVHRISLLARRSMNVERCRLYSALDCCYVLMLCWLW